MSRTGLRYIAQLIIENIQSHKKTVMNFGPGLNVITGPTDEGKSAIVRALKWLLNNDAPRGDSLFRTGETEHRVTAVFSDGVTVTREKTPSKNRYILIDSQGEEHIFEGFRYSVPEEILKATGMRPLALDEDTVLNLNIASQFEPPFLLSQPATVRAKAIGRLLGVHVVDAAARLAGKEISDSKAEAERLKKQIEEIDKNLEGFSDLDQMKENLEKAQGLAEKLSKAEEKVNLLAAKRDKARAIAQEIVSVEESLKSLGTVDKADQLLAQLIDKTSLKDALASRRDRLSKVEEGIAEAKAIINRTRSLPYIEVLLGELQDAVKRMSALKPLADRLSKNAQEIKNAEDSLRELQDVGKASALFEKVRALYPRLESLTALKKKKDACEKDLAEAVSALESTTKNMDSLIEQYADTLRSLGKCPVCFGDIDQTVVDRIVAESHQ